MEVNLLHYTIGKHNYRYTDNNDHDKAAQIQHDAEVMIEYIIGEVLVMVRFGLETFKRTRTTNPRRTTGESVVYM